MDGDSIPVTRSVAVPLSEIELRFSRSSGPGGQHAQKSETRVEALFDVEASSALSPAQKRRVIDRAGTVIKAVAQDERSQTRNRELAVERVVARLQEALRVRPARRATKPTAAAGRRRLDDKRRRGTAVHSRSSSSSTGPSPPHVPAAPRASTSAPPEEGLANHRLRRSSKPSEPDPSGPPRSVSQRWITNRCAGASPSSSERSRSSSLAPARS